MFRRFQVRLKSDCACGRIQPASGEGDGEMHVQTVLLIVLFIQLVVILSPPPARPLPPPLSIDGRPPPTFRPPAPSSLLSST